MQEMTELSELELIKKIKSPANRSEYNKACSIIFSKYENLIKKQWFTLCRQIAHPSWTYGYKDDFFSLSYEAILRAIDKIDLNRVKDNFLLIQMASWYVSNIRTDFIKKILKVEPRIESIYSASTDFKSNLDGESTLSTKSYVEQAYYENIGYMEQPDYKYFEMLEEENCERSLNVCLKKWNSVELEVYEYLSKGKSKVEISKLLNIPKAKIYYISNKMKKDLTDEIEKGKKEYSYM